MKLSGKKNRPKFTTKSLTVIGVLLIAIMSFTSCDSLLDQTPQDRISPSNFYSSASDAQAAIRATYSELADFDCYGIEIWQLADGTTDDLGLKPQEPNRTTRSLALDYSFDATNGAIEDFWQCSYESINRANAVLGNVGNIDMNADLQNQILAEARFLRSLHYFNLVRFYGNIPLRRNETTSLDSLNLEQVAPEQVYSLIISDLEQAIPNLPNIYSSGEEGRATKGAAQTLLAKVYLSRENWSEAAQLSGEVINSGNYELLPEWKEVFRIRSEFSSESVFEISFNNDLGVGSTHTAFALPFRYPGGAAYGVFYPLENLVSIYSANDVRGDNGTFMTSPHTDLSGTTHSWDIPPGPGINKWFDETSEDNLMNRGYGQMNNNWYVFRYPEVLLIYAEAINEGGSANGISKFEALNTVRSRAGLEPVTGLGQSAFRDSVYMERRRELVYEGKRWFDLKRRGILVERIRATKNPDLSQDQTLFPIPQRELDTNPSLSQNPGY